MQVYIYIQTVIQLMDGARLDLFTSGLKELSTDHTYNGHMQWSCMYRDVCVSFGAKHTV